LVEQDAEDEPAATLLSRIAAERRRLLDEGTISLPRRVQTPPARAYPFELPKSWEWVRLSDLTSQVGRGKSPVYSVDSRLPIVSQKCVQWAGLDLSVAKFVTSEFLDGIDPDRFIRRGDLLWNSTGTGTIGRIIRVDCVPDRLPCDGHVTLVRCVFVDPEYVRTWLASDSVFRSIEDRASGSTNQVELTLQMVMNQAIPLPPLAEQRRIVSRLQEILRVCAGLESAQVARDDWSARLARVTWQQITDPLHRAASVELAAAVRRVPRILTSAQRVSDLRRAILDLAVTGRLLPQRPEDEPGHALLRRVREQLESVPGQRARKRVTPVIDRPIGDMALPSSWACEALGRIVVRLDSGWSPQCDPGPRRSTDEWGVLRTTAVQRLRFNDREHKVLPTHLDPRPTMEAQIGDILITRAGPRQRVGICCLVDVVEPRLMISDKLIRIHLADELDAAFVALALNAGPTAAALESAKSGMAVMQMNISQSRLRTLPIPIPPLIEQRRIVAKVQEMMSVCDALESAIVAASQNRAKLLDTLAYELIAMCDGSLLPEDFPLVV
jgi:type I restriction enzyme S subunit